MAGPDSGDAAVAAFFERYARVFDAALRGDVDLDATASLYADAFVAATPQGVLAGANDERLRQAMADGYARYREQGLRQMRLLAVATDGIDDMHRLARVDWRALYRRDEADVPVEFRVTYLVRIDPDGPRVFGWVAGDEQAALERHGLA